jgi:acetolactate decarboxylase
MTRPARITIIAAIVTVAAASLIPPPVIAATGEGWVSQVGTYDYLVKPDYDGLAPVDSVTAGTTIGLGTFDQLNGELVMVGGVVYRVGTDGVPAIAASSATTPFLQAIRFDPDRSAPVPPGTLCSALTALVDAVAGTSGGMVAVRVRGTFTSLVTRSVPAQAEPYPTLATVVATQTIFDLGSRRAVLVGFRTGPDLAGTGAPGLHLHGLTADRTAGGHVISCVAGKDVQLSVQVADGVRVSGQSERTSSPSASAR